ncbi:MAG TPA: hypothetical protein VJS91_05380 [Nitrososphaeraceae archaeon]|nr:hypothetical protein [Nitrososphaeraceae archaeon]
MPLQDLTLFKLKLFGIINVLVALGTVPVTISHITHLYMVYDIILHVVSLAISIFLAYIGVAAYVRDGRARLLFMSLGFVTLAIFESLLLLSATDNIDITTIPTVNIELPHLVLLVVITLFGIGVLKVK